MVGIVVVTRAALLIARRASTWTISAPSRASWACRSMDVPGRNFSRRCAMTHFAGSLFDRSRASADGGLTIQVSQTLFWRKTPPP